MIDRQLIHKYFERRCTPEELQRMVDWLADDDADHRLLEEVMQDRWEEQETGRQLSRHRFPRYAAVAAAVTVIAAALWLLIYNGNGHTNKQGAPAWVSVTDTGIHIQRLLLPDSSEVWLSPGSQISYSMASGGDRRLVRLNGQAFFDVKRDAVRPFIVYTGDIATKVLGTAFNIEAYPNEKNIRVSLVSGSVAVQRPPGAGRPAMEEVLSSGKMFTYAKDAGTGRKDPLAITDMADWTGGHIVFNDVPVRTALERLARLYHFHLAYDKGTNLDNNRFSTVFNDELPEQMIRNILFITEYTYRLRGNELRIIRKN